MSAVYSWIEVRTHNKPDDLRVVIRGDVYDVTKFQHEHPGGPEFLLDQGGGDVTELFEDAGHSNEARSLLSKLKVGIVEDQACLLFQVYECKLKLEYLTFARENARRQVRQAEGAKVL